MPPQYLQNADTICRLSKQIADHVGYSSGQSYLLNLIDGVKSYLDVSTGYIYEVNYRSENLLKLIASGPGNSDRTSTHPAQNPQITEQILNENKQGSIVRSDSTKTINSPCGDGKHHSIACFRLYDSNGILIGIALFLSDESGYDSETIREVIETQIPRASSELEAILLKNKLKIFENNYNNLVDSTLDVIWESDLAGNLTKINDTCKAVYGFLPNQMLGMNYSEFMSYDSARNFKKYLELTTEGKNTYNALSDHISSNNKLIKVRINTIPKYDEHENIVGLVGSTRDISASTRARETIKNNSELFSSILSRLPVIFFRVDEKGFLVDIRGNGLKRMGVEDMDWVGRPGYGLFIGMDAKIDSALSGNTVFFENKGTYQGTPWWFYTSMFFDSWSGYGAVGFSVDITEQKVVEEQLVELLTNNRKLAQKLVEVQEDERRNLARELHDELGQSITAVKSLATIISTSSDQHHGEINTISRSIIELSSRLYDVVNNIMQRLRPDIIDGLDFTETLRNCVVRSQLETMGVNCALSIKGEINDFDEVVKITIYRIIQECLTNISKHAMASNVSISIIRGPHAIRHTEAAVYSQLVSDEYSKSPLNKDIVTVAISDDGIGIDKADILDSPPHNTRHGLQGIKERVAAMGGGLSITTEPGKGVAVQAVIALGDITDDFKDSFSETDLHGLEKPQRDRIQTH